MQTDFQSILVGALIALGSVWFTFRLTQAQTEKDRKEEFRALLILLHWQVQTIAAFAAQQTCPVELKMPAYALLITKGFFARLPTKIRDHLLCLEIGIEGANRANALLWRGPGLVAAPDKGIVLTLLRTEVANNLKVVRKEAASVLAAFVPLFKDLKVEEKEITDDESAQDSSNAVR